MIYLKHNFITLQKLKTHFLNIPLGFDWSVNLIEVSVSILTVFLIFIVYRLLDKQRERKQLETIFIRVKNIISSFYESRDSISLGFPYLRFQKENLGKLGIILNDFQIYDGFLTQAMLSETPNVKITKRHYVESLNIVDKFFIKENKIYNIDKNNIISEKEEFENILNQIKIYTKENYNIKIKITNKLN
ncbi:hypothetical protein ES705_16301 [subsurface metagenome]